MAAAANDPGAASGVLAPPSCGDQPPARVPRAAQPVATDTFSLTQESEIGHIRLADQADAIVIAPVTANALGKLANGSADDLLTTVLLAERAPLVLAPAMNVHMWEHAAVQENLARLIGRGARVVGPASGALACGYEGTGRLAEPADIVEEVCCALTAQDLRGERVLVSAGPTREPIDPVRYLSNHSSGKMGYAVARVARGRGAAEARRQVPRSHRRQRRDRARRGLRRRHQRGASARRRRPGRRAPRARQGGGGGARARLGRGAPAPRGHGYAAAGARARSSAAIASVIWPRRLSARNLRRSTSARASASRPVGSACWQALLRPRPRRSWMAPMQSVLKRSTSPRGSG